MRLCFHRAGAPAEVLQLEPWEPPAPGAREVIVRQLFAPIHPADLNFIEGVYGTQPVLPAVPGNEGCGRVETVGAEVRSLAPGDLVIPLRPSGCWSQRILAAEDDLWKVSAQLDPLQAAMLRVNPATAWHLLRDFRPPDPGAFVAQNASNSAVGRALIQLARHFGVRTLNFVRRADVAAELTALGADAVIPDDDDGLAAARKIAGDRAPHLACNAVGGESGLRLMELLAPGGMHVTYGAMSRRGLQVPARFLIFKDLHVRGCWISRHIAQSPRVEVVAILDTLAKLMEAGKLKLPVDEIFELSGWRQAVARAQEGGRSGKVLLRLQA